MMYSSRGKGPSPENGTGTPDWTLTMVRPAGHLPHDRG